MKNLFFLSLTIISITIHGSKDKDRLIAHVTINNQLDDRAKVLIAAALHDSDIRRKEVWCNDRLTYSTTYIRKPMFEFKSLKELLADKRLRMPGVKMRQMYISRSIDDKKNKEAKKIKNAIDNCWGEARSNYRRKKTVWVCYKSGLVELIKENGVIQKTPKKVDQKNVTLDSDEDRLSPINLSGNDSDNESGNCLSQGSRQE